MKFKVGDRVIVYNAQVFPTPNGYFWGPFIGVVKKVDAKYNTIPDYLEVTPEWWTNGKLIKAHPMQCRLVKIKKKRSEK